MEWKTCRCDMPPTNPGQPSITTIWADAVAMVIALLSAWVVREYDKSLGPLTGPLITSEEDNLRGLTAGERMPYFAILSGQPLLLVIASSSFYAASVSTIYCLHRHDRHINTALGIGSGTAITVGLLQGTGMRETLVQLVPGALGLSLVLSAFFHHIDKSKTTENLYLLQQKKSDDTKLSVERMNEAWTDEKSMV